jgi:hypothetical protein
MLLSPNTTPAKPMPDSATESTSSGIFWVSVTLRIMVTPRTRASAATGSISRNIQRHCSRSRITPPMVGPVAGATAMTMEITPMVRPRRLAGTTFSTVVNSSGIMMAVPTAWTTRPRTRTRNVGAMAASTVPSRKLTMAMVNTVRSGNRVSR